MGQKTMSSQVSCAIINALHTNKEYIDFWVDEYGTDSTQANFELGWRYGFMKAIDMLGFGLLCPDDSDVPFAVARFEDYTIG